MADHDIDAIKSEREYEAALAAADTSLDTFNDVYVGDCLTYPAEPVAASEDEHPPELERQPNAQ